jgi:hypothetical protein
MNWMKRCVLILTLSVIISDSSKANFSFVFPAVYSHSIQKSLPDSIPFRINGIRPYVDLFDGHRYYSSTWLHGNVISADNTQIANDDYFYNYDLISNSLLITTDLQQIIEVDKREFKSFTLLDGPGVHHFEHLFIIDNKKFFEKLVSSNKYSLYKWTYVKFRRRDVLGNAFTDLSDVSLYYVVYPGGRVYDRINLKKRSILKKLSFESAKTKKYFSDHPDAEINEDFLVGLINNLNQ